MKVICEEYQSCKNICCNHIEPHEYNLNNVYRCDHSICSNSPNKYCQCVSINILRKEKLSKLQLL